MNTDTIADLLTRIRNALAVNKQTVEIPASNLKREILKILGKNLGISIDIKKLDKEITEIESEIIKKTKEFTNVSKTAALKKLKSKFKDVDYIG